MTQTGPGTPPPAQPGQPYQAWGPGQQPAPPAGQPPVGQPPVGAPATKSNVKKWALLAGTVVVAGGVAAFTLTGGFGLGDPEIGDCVQMQGETDFTVVDCAGAEAEYRVVGIDDREQTYEDSYADPETCAAFPDWEVALWIGGDVMETGTTYCAVPAA